MAGRIAENVVVAIATAVAVRLMDHAGNSGAFVASATRRTAGIGATIGLDLLVASLVCFVAATVVLVVGWRQADRSGLTFWEVELHMPSWPTTIFGLGLVLLLVWIGVRLCVEGSDVGLVPICVGAWIVLRFAARLRQRWVALFTLF